MKYCTLLEIKNISISYNTEYILKNLSYKFKYGLVYGLIGKNGAGKTTLLKIIMRLIRKNTGDILIENTSINNVDFFKIPATFINDSPIFYTDLTVYEQLLLICKFKHLPKKQALDNINELLYSLKLIKYKNYFPTTLSKGTLQRLNIAMGIIRDEKIILMDEPFNALDPVQVSSVENLILESKNKGKTLLISSHDIDSLKAICDVYLILKNGQLLEYYPNQLSKENISDIIEDSYGE